MENSTTASRHDTDVTFHQHAERRAKTVADEIRSALSDAWRHHLDTLRVELDARLAGLQTALDDSAVAGPIGRLAEELSGAAQSQLDEAAGERAALVRKIEALQAQTDAVIAAAQAEAESVRAAAQTEIQAARAELTATIETARAREAALSELLTAAQQDVATARQEVRERAARLEVTEERLQALERSQTAPPLARLRGSLRALAGVSQTHDVLTTFLQELERGFDRVALFVVHGNRLEGRQTVGFEPTTDVSNLIIPFTVDSPLTRAVSGQTTILVEADEDQPSPGLLGHETYGALAIPIVVEQRHVAVAYAELARHLPPESRQIELEIAEILAEHVMGSLAHLEKATATAAVVSNAEAPDVVGSAAASFSRPAAAIAATFPGPARAAERVRMPESVEVVVDGAAAQLVDISNLGAQVTCAKTLRPNHQVRMVLPQAGQNALCCGQVVWALFEIGPAGGRYRAGLKFTNVDTGALDAFLGQHVATAQRTSA